jgi:hypothetical protein
MNNLSPQQRKLIYLGGIVVLLIVTIVLGRPSGGVDETGQADPGGVLARMRTEHELGESTLGKVDPSSAAMNLVLLGMRGVAVNQLWMQHDEAKRTKDWPEMRSLADSIITLQPHFLDVWRYHGWDLAFNVSAAWDQVEDRFFWVKEGTKFTMEGVERNEGYPELAWEVGRMTGPKIGRSDEWHYFRRFYVADPDPQFEGGPDPALNPLGKDNYLRAREWFLLANKIDDRPDVRQRMMMDALFRHYPARALYDYADALQREGVFTDRTGVAWQDAYREWTEVYGREEFESSYGTIIQGATEAEIRALAEEEGLDPDEKVLVWEGFKRQTNFDYWKSRAFLEKNPEMVIAHREMYDGRQGIKRGDTIFSGGTPSESMRLLESGMRRFERLTQGVSTGPAAADGEDAQEDADGDGQGIDDYKKDLENDVTLIEEGMLSLYYWRWVYDLYEGVEIPEDYPLKKLWEQHSEDEKYRDQFERDLRAREL